MLCGNVHKSLLLAIKATLTPDRYSNTVQGMDSRVTQVKFVCPLPTNIHVPVNASQLQIKKTDWQVNCIKLGS